MEKVKIKVRWSVLLLTLLLSACQEAPYEEVALPQVFMETPELLRPDSVLFSAEVIDAGFSAFRREEAGFLLTDGHFGEDFTTSGGTWEFPGQGTGDSRFQATYGNLVIDQEYEVVPYLELAFGETQKPDRVYGNVRNFYSGRINLSLSFTEADYQITVNYNLTGLATTEAYLPDYGLCWLSLDEPPGGTVSFELAEVPEDQVLSFGPTDQNINSRQETPAFDRGKYIYLRAYALYQEKYYYSDVYPLFIGNYWETRGPWDLPNTPDDVTSAVGFSLNGKGHVATGRLATPSPYPDSLTYRMWEYDPGANEWTAREHFPGGRREFATAFVLGGKAYVGLGRNDDGDQFKDFWEYTPDQGWRAVADYPYESEHNVSFVIGNKAYVGTGIKCVNPDICLGSTNQFFAFDPTQGEPDPDGIPKGEWQPVADCPSTFQSGVGFAINGKGYVGTGYHKASGSFYRNFYAYDPGTDLWTEVAPFGGEGRQHAMSFVVDGQAYVGGGAYYANLYIQADFKDFWRYDPVGDQWTQVADLGVFHRADGATFTIGDKGYLYGGQTVTGISTIAKTLEVYIPDR